jgi:hypothetical protein
VSRKAGELCATLIYWPADSAYRPSDFHSLAWKRKAESRPGPEPFHAGQSTKKPCVSTQGYQRVIVIDVFGGHAGV